MSADLWGCAAIAVGIGVLLFYGWWTWPRVEVKPRQSVLRTKPVPMWEREEQA
jgi:hypothetical protein